MTLNKTGNLSGTVLTARHSFWSGGKKQEWVSGKLCWLQQLRGLSLKLESQQNSAKPSPLTCAQKAPDTTTLCFPMLAVRNATFSYFSHCTMAKLWHRTITRHVSPTNHLTRIGWVCTFSFLRTQTRQAELEWSSWNQNTPHEDGRGLCRREFTSLVFQATEAKMKRLQR